MNNGILKKLMICIALFGITGAAQALSIPNPDNTVYADDVNGNGLFVHGSGILSLELFDLADLLGAAAAPPQLAIGSEFGFYYGNDPLTRNPIFQADDNYLLGPQSAAVNFDTGSVFDLDAGGVIPQNSFVSQGNTEIGFYLLVAGATTPIFTQAILNPGGEDLAAEFPFLAEPLSLLIAFAVPNGADPLALGLQVVYPLVPSPVPLPGALGLWILGLSGLALFRRKIAAGKKPDLVPLAA